jgi:predicted ATP-grasp superfamily ATP-dependent carboligase
MIEAKAFLVFSGTNDRAVLAFLRALSLCGHRAYIVARTPADRILRTRYRRDVALVRETSELTLATLLDCLRRVRQISGDRKLVILPSSEFFNNLMLQHRAEIESLGFEIPLVDAAVYGQLTNKRTAAALFAAAGIDIPKEYPTIDRDRLPLVAKPIRNVDARGVTLYPVLLHTVDDVRQFEATSAVEDFFFQEFVRGQSLYLLAHVSRDPARTLVWSQRNLLQQPQGKSMLLAEPCVLHEAPIAKRLIEVLVGAQFVGLGMVELIQDGSRFVFIEMNPRIWGPIQFCLDQDQPLLQAFIGSCLHNEPERYLGVRSHRGRSYYCWAGGVVDTPTSGPTRAVWHADRMSWARFGGICIGNDVYLRADSWRCFCFEFGQSILKALHGRSNQG